MGRKAVVKLRKCVIPKNTAAEQTQSGIEQVRAAGAPLGTCKRLLWAVPHHGSTQGQRGAACPLAEACKS